MEKYHFRLYRRVASEMNSMLREIFLLERLLQKLFCYCFFIFRNQFLSGKMAMQYF
jgi:hypothetical protein